ncbi:MAG: hypothetical protein KME45_27255 [Stenomitos rutilans HA7619-LM2]|jgi:hypothetical protein|nr:hypothetical protein [Stenomitos rutilans HA7619-LM2]
MRISPVLFLPPVLVLSGSSAIANDDRPASPQPAIVSPTLAPLTIESLAGTYTLDDEERWVATRLEEMQKDGLDDETLKSMEILLRRSFITSKVTIAADGKFEFQELDFKADGQVKHDSDKFILTIDLAKLIKRTDGSTNPLKCTKCCTFTLNVSADGQKLLRYDFKKSSKLLRVYVKR